MKNFSYRAAKKLKRHAHSLLKYLHLQLFLTLCSWPVLLTWGLPLSYASIVGNYIFTPFLMLFLLVSSFIFFCELLYIPNSPFIYFLEWITTIWTALLALSNRSWLFSCPLPSKLVPMLLPLVACLILQHKKILSPVKNSLALLTFLIMCCLLFKCTTLNRNAISSISCFDKEVTILQAGSHGFLIDPGALGRRISAPSWAGYTLLPTLSRQGIIKLTIICARPTPMAFQTLQVLVDSLEVTCIYMPAWGGTLKNRGWASWEKLLSIAKKNGTKIELLHNPLTLKLGTYILELNQDNKVTRKNKMAYYSLTTKY